MRPKNKTLAEKFDRVSRRLAAAVEHHPALAKEVLDRLRGELAWARRRTTDRARHEANLVEALTLVEAAVRNHGSARECEEARSVVNICRRERADLSGLPRPMDLSPGDWRQAVNGVTIASRSSRLFLHDDPVLGLQPSKAGPSPATFAVACNVLSEVLGVSAAWLGERIPPLAPRDVTVMRVGGSADDWLSEP